MDDSTTSAKNSGRFNQSHVMNERVSTYIGFSLMLAWHYLLLFSPAYGDINLDDAFTNDYLFARQLTLYLSLAVSFYLIWAYGKWRMKRERDNSRSMHILIIGWVSVAISLLFEGTTYLGCDLWIRLILIGLLSLFQAYMMTLWMRCLMRKNNGSVVRPFGLFMISGGAIALLICLLQWPATLFGAALIPGLSSIFLFHERLVDQSEDARIAQEAMAEEATVEVDIDGSAETITSISEASVPSDTNAQGSYTEAEDKSISTRNKRMLLFAAMFSLTFGLMQGAFTVADIPILIVNNSYVLIGIVLAGVMLHIIPKSLGVTLSVDMMHRYSVILFVVGSVVIMWNNLGFIPVFFSQVALLAGFNLFDFGLFTYGIEGHWNNKKAPTGADFARPIVYICMSAGLPLGFIAATTCEPLGFIPEVLLVICGICIMLIVCTTLFPFMKLSSPKDGASADASTDDEEAQKSHMILSLSSFATETALVEDTPQSSEGRLASPWRNACNAVAEQYGLSPRETEIFMLVAKGRNADYIQSKLIISTHTAKTHIANIYHKLAIHSAQELLDLVEEYKGSEK